jgi:cupin fold WbuC family metalloprotein
MELSIKTREFNEEVLFADEPVIKVGPSDIQELKDRASRNRRRTIRLCAHRDVDDKVHEMLIVHARDTYVRPHKHLTKNASFHIVEGSGEFVIFDDSGEIGEIVPIGDYSTGRKFYYRLSEPRFYTLVINSDFLVFHETISGPFDRSDTEWASWSPEESDQAAAVEFAAELVRRVSSAVV